MKKRGGKKLYRMLNGMKKRDILNLAVKTCDHGKTYLEHPACYAKETGLTERIGFFDIETSNLKADFGIMFSYAIKDQYGEIIGRTVTPKEMRTEVYDKKIVEECCEDLRKFDRVVTHFGTRFDLPFVRARAIYHGCDFPVYQEVYHTDTYYMARSRLCISRRRLETICEFFGIPAKGHKMNQTMWMRAVSGNKEALDYIWAHNIEDVVSLQAVFELLQDYSLTNRRSV